MKNSFSQHVALILCLASGAVATAVLSIEQPVQPTNFAAKPKGLMKGVKEPSAKGEEPAHHVGANLKCGVTNKVTSKTDKYEDCPADCPFFAQNRLDTDTCGFVCAPAQDCKVWNPKKPIADFVKKSKTCRGPKVDFCSESALDGTDTCLNCQYGFHLFMEDGQCYFSYFFCLYSVVAVVLVVVVVAVVWFVNLMMRPTINEAEVKRGVEWRSRSKILMTDSTGHRHCYPIETNLTKQDVAGPGMLLHFNFQAFCIFWPLVVAIIWTILACFHNELFYLGTRRFGTPRHNCILVAWGYETQQALMWTKVLFLVIVYLFSFTSFLLFGIRQYRIYERMVAEEKTMAHFAVELKGLPELSGSKECEDTIKKAVVDCCCAGKAASVVGVSVCWNFGDKEDDIMKAVKDDQYAREKELGPLLGMASVKPENTDAPDDFTPTQKKIYNMEKRLLDADPASLEELDEAAAKTEITTMLNDLKSSESAFVVFSLEGEKTAAMKKAEEGSLKLTHEGKEYTLTLEDLECEPTTVNWQNFGDSSTPAMLKRFAYGFSIAYLPALSIWFFVFYVPYAYSLYNFNYDNGAELPGIYSIVFTMVVVGGNATMYVVCDLCCDIIGFRYKDTKQVVYMLFYLVACMINVLLDMVVTYYTALKIMVGLDFRTYFGQRVADVDSFTEQFETYAMQRSLAENTYRYAFPSTFLVPFLIEPVITVLIPYQLGKLIIRTRKGVWGSATENYIQAFDFDMGRYADILLNVFLGILIFYFPGGYTWSLFYGMFISHIVIYIFDHWRVLNVIPSVKIVSRAVDWWAQATLAACCGLIMSVLVFKMNCESYAGYCLKTTGLLTACTVAGIAHTVIHIVLLIYLVPALGKTDCQDSNPDTTYAEIASTEPSTWFSVNPVHCLRSKYIHQHKPWCRFQSVGRDHLLQKNPKIGCHYEAAPADTEDFSGYKLKDFSDTFKALAGSVVGSKAQAPEETQTK